LKASLASTKFFYVFLDLAAIRFSLRCFFRRLFGTLKNSTDFPTLPYIASAKKGTPFREEPHLAHYREYLLGFELFVMDLFLSGGKGEGGGES